MSLADSWSQYPQYFEPFLTDENENENENLGLILAQIAEYREIMEESGINLIQKMGHPFAYLTGVSIAVSITLFYVIPIFADMFYSFGVDLPAQTRFFISISDWLVANDWLILSGVLGLGALLWIKWQSVKLYIPLFGRFYRKIALVRSLRTCAFMISYQALS
jgi:type IV pilus assembly protein PilC